VPGALTPIPKQKQMLDAAKRALGDKALSAAFAQNAPGTILGYKQGDWKCSCFVRWVTRQSGIEALQKTAGGFTNYRAGDLADASKAITSWAPKQ
jgi:hypothetical protein